MSTLPDFLTTTPPPVPPPSETRLRALYASSSSQRSTNPTGYVANVSWWVDVIVATVRSGYLNGEDGDRLILSVTDGLTAKYGWGGRRPKGLGGVIETQATSTPPKFHPLGAFMSSPTPLHLPPTFTSKYVGRPLWWALAQLNPFGGASADVSEDVLWKRWGMGKEYVCMDLLEQAAALFMKHLSDDPPLSYSASLYDMAGFRYAFGELCFPGGKKGLPSGDHRLGKKDCEVLIKWLGRDCGVLVSDGSVVKILDEGEDVAEHEITEADKGTIAILNTLKKVESQIADIEKQIETCQVKAKKQLSNNQRNLAVTYLRSKKSLEELLDKRVAVMEQLQTVIRKIDQAKGDIEIMAAYERSTMTLGEILKNPKLDADYIASTTDALADTLADAKEIEDAVADGGKIAVGARGDAVDEDELKEELEALVREEKERQEVEEAAKRKAEEAVKEKDKEQEKERPTEEAQKPLEPKEAAEKASEKTKAKQGASAEGRSEAESEAASEEWKRRYEDAQQREKEEKTRAESERLAKEARLEAA